MLADVVGAVDDVGARAGGVFAKQGHFVGGAAQAHEVAAVAAGFQVGLLGNQPDVGQVAAGGGQAQVGPELPGGARRGLHRRHQLKLGAGHGRAVALQLLARDLKGSRVARPGGVLGKVAVGEAVGQLGRGGGGRQQYQAQGTEYT